MNKMIQNSIKVVVNKDNFLAWTISKMACEILKERHDDFSTEVVLADKRKIEIEEDNYYTFYYTREDLKDVDKYIEWIKSVV